MTLVMTFTALGLSIYAVILSTTPGETGARGLTGAKGSTGGQGTTGAVGATGAVGSQGLSIGNPAYGQVIAATSSQTQVFNLNDAIHLWVDTSVTGWVGNVNVTASVGELGTISATADRGDGTVRFTTGAAHGMAVDDPVSITSTTNHDEVWTVIAVSDSTHFEVNDPYSGGSETGEFQRGTALQIVDPGDYMFVVSMAAMATSDAPKIDHSIYLGSVHQHFHGLRGYSISAGSTSMAGLMTIATDDFVTIGLMRTSGTGNIEIVELTMSVHRVSQS